MPVENVVGSNNENTVPLAPSNVESIITYGPTCSIRADSLDGTDVEAIACNVLSITVRNADAPMV